MNPRMSIVPCKLYVSLIIMTICVALSCSYMWFLICKPWINSILIIYLIIVQTCMNMLDMQACHFGLTHVGHRSVDGKCQ